MRQFIFLILVFCVAQMASGAAPQPWWKRNVPFKEAYSLEHSVGPEGSAILTLANTKLKVGEKFMVDIRFEDGGVGGSVFNPFFNPLLPAPAALVMYNAKKEFVGNYLAPTSGSRSTPGSADYPFLPGNDCYVGVKLTFWAGHGTGFEGKSMPPGKYYLQVVFYRAFVTFNPTTRPAKTLGDIRHFYDGFDRGELFRSNIVEIELTK
jgi:hypothetical protein